jgi:hypothetical protein
MIFSIFSLNYSLYNRVAPQESAFRIKIKDFSREFILIYEESSVSLHVLISPSNKLPLCINYNNIPLHLTSYPMSDV